MSKQMPGRIGACGKVCIMGATSLIVIVSCTGISYLSPLAVERGV